jgi:hypothetical protein
VDETARFSLNYFRFSGRKWKILDWGDDANKKEFKGD